jgi:hypothetical protein
MRDKKLLWGILLCAAVAVSVSAQVVKGSEPAGANASRNSTTSATTQQTSGKSIPSDPCIKPKARKSGGEHPPICHSKVRKAGGEGVVTPNCVKSRNPGGQAIVRPNCVKTRNAGGQGIVRPNCVKAQETAVGTGVSTNARKAGGQGVVRPNCTKIHATPDAGANVPPGASVPK